MKYIDIRTNNKLVNHKTLYFNNQNRLFATYAQSFDPVSFLTCLNHVPVITHLKYDGFVYNCVVMLIFYINYSPIMFVTINTSSGTEM